MAWVMATMWDSVNEPRNGEPRCPLVPKLTSWSGAKVRLAFVILPLKPGEVDQHLLRRCPAG